jgi:hypothetical protein
MQELFSLLNYSNVRIGMKTLPFKVLWRFELTQKLRDFWSHWL